MTNDELNPEEKANMLAICDHFNLYDSDPDIDAALKQITLPDVDRLEDRARRTFFKIISGYVPDHLSNCEKEGLSGEDATGALGIIMLCLGYELGRRVQKPIFH